MKRRDISNDHARGSDPRDQNHLEDGAVQMRVNLRIESLRQESQYSEARPFRFQFIEQI